ncbi:hypothetical protein L6164_012221 [Bauhinia variegata]|uniref:Uncharacterized protein n=1 Tax=Bauhinia variegata TaxID=167791 RepID=A0ACB9P8T4_BAUVA|nr:hypothetical protein L6164_012221 [Bauhinia variegata]
MLLNQPLEYYPQTKRKPLLLSHLQASQPVINPRETCQLVPVILARKGVSNVKALDILPLNVLTIEFSL